MSCPMCGGFGYLLGCLGRLAWLRCRNCGIEFNIPADTLPDFIDEDSE